MPFEPIRFIHASNLRLDSQLRDVGACPDELRGLIETATMTSFERVLDACVAHGADFLLLTGNSFDERERSLPARLALLEGIRRLEQHDIRVFVLPGDLDPPEAWQAFPETADNVTTFFNPSTGAVAVLRDGKVIASVASVELSDGDGVQHSAPPRAEEGAAQRGPFRIGLCCILEEPSQPDAGLPPADKEEQKAVAPGPSPAELASEEAGASAGFRLPSLSDLQPFDYLALGCSDERQTLERASNAAGGVAHSPGAPQALCAAEAGVRGCTLVEVAADGSVDCRLVPTAPVRFENFAVGIDARSTQADLLERMRGLLDEQPAHPSESLWMINWTVACSGSLYESLCDDESARGFIEQAADQLASDSRPQMLHSLQVLPDRAAVERVRQQHAWAAGYFDALEADVPLTRAALIDSLGETAASCGEFANRMRRLSGGVDRRVILGKARQYGIEQLQRTANAET